MRAASPRTFGRCSLTAAFPKRPTRVLALLSGVTSSVKGGSCADATPNDGVLVECDVQPGATLEWMAYRPNIRKHNRTPGRLERIPLGGKERVQARSCSA